MDTTLTLSATPGQLKDWLREQIRLAWGRECAEQPLQLSVRLCGSGVFVDGVPAMPYAGVTFDFKPLANRTCEVRIRLQQLADAEGRLPVGVEAMLDQLLAALRAEFEPAPQDNSAGDPELPPAEEMRQYYPDYNEATARMILELAPNAWEYYRQVGGRWSAGAWTDLMRLNRATISRYLGAFKRAGITRWKEVWLP